MMKFTLDTEVSILGTIWDISVVTEEDDSRLTTCNGLTDNSSKTIHLCQMPPEANLDEPIVFIRKVIRHEIIHAFMFESGLAESWHHNENGQEEMTVDWIALQFHKIEDVIKQVYEKLSWTDQTENGERNVQ